MEHTTSEWKDEGSVRPARRSKPRVEEQYDAPERDEKRASAAALAHIEATVGKKINSVVGDVAAKRLTAKLALALDAFERERWQDAKRIIIPRLPRHQTDPRDCRFVSVPIGPVARRCGSS
jgi:hypothetical protein